MTTEECPWPHDNISILSGVEPTPIADLPKICVCGHPITYAKEVIFVVKMRENVAGSDGLHWEDPLGEPALSKT